MMCKFMVGTLTGNIEDADEYFRPFYSESG